MCRSSDKYFWPYAVSKIDTYTPCPRLATIPIDPYLSVTGPKIAHIYKYFNRQHCQDILLFQAYHQITSNLLTLALATW